MISYDKPVKVESVYLSKIWGGRRIERDMNRPYVAEDIGEAWDISAFGEQQSTVTDGRERMLLGEYARGEDFYGKRAFESFPLLIKTLGAEDKLSVQVHPSDSNCAPSEAGKAEAWYVIACEEGAQLVMGLNCTKEKFAEAISMGRTGECLNKVSVHSGDVFNIRPGLVHAIGAGITIYEVQQTSDTTYRVFDYDRKGSDGKPRALHIERSLAVIDDGMDATRTPGLRVLQEGGSRTLFLSTENFKLEQLDMEGTFADTFFGCFAAYTVLEGEASVQGLSLKKGEVMLAPAKAGRIVFQGRARMLRSNLPREADYAAFLRDVGAAVTADGRVVRHN